MDEVAWRIGATIAESVPFDLDLNDALELYVTEFAPSALSSLDDLPERVHRLYFLIRSGASDRIRAQDWVQKGKGPQFAEHQGEKPRFVELVTKLRSEKSRG